MLLTLDLATTTGWCAGAGDISPALGHVRMPDTKEDVGAFLYFYRKWLHRRLDDLMEDGNMDVDPSPEGMKLKNRRDLIVVFEAPLLPRAQLVLDPVKGKQLKQAPVTAATARKLMGLAGLTEMVAIERNCLCEEVNLQSVKKALGGSGGKEDMMAAAKRCGLSPKVHDEADAFGIWILAVRAYAKQFQRVWDQRLYGPSRLV